MSFSDIEFSLIKKCIARRKPLTDLRKSLASFLLWSNREVTLVFEEELGSHLEMIVSAISMFSSIMVSENLWRGVEGLES